MAHDRLPLRLSLPSHEALRPFAAGALAAPAAHLRSPAGRAAYAEIAAEEGFSRERLRQIIRAATAPGRGHDGPDHKRMQIARLTPALRLAADGVAQGDAKSIPLLLKIIDRLDRYSDPLDFGSPNLFTARRRPRSSRRGKPAATKPASASDALGRSAEALPECPLPAEQVLGNAQNGKG